MTGRPMLPFPIPFTKMSGTGNDFIIIDHRHPFLAEDQMRDFARLVCRRQFSVGADGLILITTTSAVDGQGRPSAWQAMDGGTPADGQGRPSDGRARDGESPADFAWRFFNADGSVAEMCGNGARCAARYAFDHQIAPARMRFLTLAGVIQAEVRGESVKLKMTTPTSLQLNRRVVLDGSEQIIHSINTGVPHAALFSADVRRAAVTAWGRTIRFHSLFQPAGTNANFVEVAGPNLLLVRTYERGVEDETMACGTGAVAAALIAFRLGHVTPPVTVVTSGGEELVIHFTWAEGAELPAEVHLEGPADIIYHGKLMAEALRQPGKALV